VALLQTLTYAACGLLEMTVMSDKRKGSLKDYALLCTLTQGGMLFTNWYAAQRVGTFSARVILFVE